jgi:hypothetical protein
MDPASPKSNGGSDSSAKKAASAASPVTRLRKHVPTVETSSRQVVSRTTNDRRRSGEGTLSDFTDMALR